MYIFGKCIFILDICCQQFGEYVSVEYICWYWIYHANNWGMNVSWRVSLCPSGTEWGNIYFGDVIYFGKYILVEYVGW